MKRVLVILSVLLGIQIGMLAARFFDVHSQPWFLVIGLTLLNAGYVVWAWRQSDET